MKANEVKAPQEPEVVYNWNVGRHSDDPRGYLLTQVRR